MLNDLRYACRMLGKNPSFTTVAVLTLALGIGANGAILSLLDNVLWRPLPVKDPDQLVAVFQSDPSMADWGIPAENTRYGNLSYPDYSDYRDQNAVFSGLAAYWSRGINLSGGDHPERIPGALVSGNYFSVLGVKAAIGRLILAEDDQPGAQPVAVLSHEIWRRQFDGDPTLVGKTVKLDGYRFTVVGIAPAGFKGTSLELPRDIWVPLLTYAHVTGKADQLSELTNLWVLGRLKPGISLPQAQAAMDTLARRLGETYSATNKGKVVTLVSATQAKVWPPSRASVSHWMGLLAAVVGLVLLIACANVANLLLTRATRRQREMGIRLALGASRGRLIRQLLIESLLLALLGAAVGLLLAYWTTQFLSFRLALAIPIKLEASLDARVCGFTILIATLAGLFSGLVPGLRSSKPDLVPTLKGEVARTVGLSQSGVRHLLVILQVALSLIVLVAAGLFVRSLQKELSVDLGFQAGNVLLLSMDLEHQEYSESRGKRFCTELVQRLQSVPGVRSVSLSALVPFTDMLMRMLVTAEGNVPQPEEGSSVDTNSVGLKYFQIMGIPVLQGRDFNEYDREGAPAVVIVNQTMAKRFWPGQNPIGQRLSLSGRAGPYHEVIGVVKDAKYYDLHEQTLPYLYVPLLQGYRPIVTLYVATVDNPKDMLLSVRREIMTLDPALPVFATKTLSEGAGAWVSRGRTVALLLSLFGIVALLLAAVGIYGVLAYSISQRTHEIGIRMALGAQASSVLSLVIAEGIKLVLVGVAIGLVSAIALTRLIASFLFGLSATDTVTFVSVSLLLIGVASLACYLPARRATKVDPMVALGYE